METDIARHKKMCDELDENSYNHSIEYLSPLIERHPNNVDLLFERAIRNEKISDNGKAIDDFKQILKLDPSRLNIYHHLVTCHLLEGELDEAHSASNLAIDNCPNEPLSHYCKALCLIVERRFGAAEICLKNSISLDSESDFYWGDLGRVYLHLQKFKKAKKCLHRACELREKAAYYINLARICMEEKDPTSAIEFLTTATAHKTRSVDSLLIEKYLERAKKMLAI